MYEVVLLYAARAFWLCGGGAGTMLKEGGGVGLGWCGVMIVLVVPPHSALYSRWAASVSVVGVLHVPFDK